MISTTPSLRAVIAFVLGFALAGCSSSTISVPVPVPPTVPQAACQPTTGTPAGTAATLLAILNDARKTHQLNAVIFDATKSGAPMLTTAIGNSIPGVPATTSMHFRVGMAAEQFEMNLLMQLVDKKSLDLREFVSKWYPSYPYGGLATLRMVADSTSGFGDYVYGPADPAKHIRAFADIVNDHPYREFAPSELVRRSYKPYQVPAFVIPGKAWGYSHSNYVMLGSIIETASKRNYAAFVQNAILSPLLLRNTAYAATSGIPSPVLAAFTSERGSYENSTYWSPSWTSFSGAMTSNVCDLATWSSAYGSGALLSRASFAKIIAPTTVGLAQNTPALYFGLGTIVNNHWLVASGNYFGWHTGTAYYMPGKIALVVTITESAKTKDAGRIVPSILRAMSNVLTPGSPITLP
jgi:D-alanyl-D-alanine carboxypeptidase